MSFVPLILSVVGAVASGIGTIMQGQAQSEAMKYNAQVQEIAARTAINQSAAKAQEIERKNRVRTSQMVAGAAGSGFSLTGSVGDAIDYAGDLGTLDALTEVYNGQVEAVGHRNQAALDRFSAKNAMRAGLIGGVTGIIGGVGKSFMDAGYGSSSSSLSNG